MSETVKVWINLDGKQTKVDSGKTLAQWNEMDIDEQDDLLLEIALQKVIGD